MITIIIVENKYYLDIIEKELKKKKISEKKLCEDLGYSRSLLQQWRKGSEPSVIKLIKIAEYLGLEKGYLTTGEEKEKINTEEKQLINYFRQLTEKEQMKELARLELIIEQQEEQEKKKISTSKLSV